MVTGDLVDLQRILPDGDKLNLTDGRVDGTWFIIGKPRPKARCSWPRALLRAQPATSHRPPGGRRLRQWQPHGRRPSSCGSSTRGAHHRSGGRRLEEAGQSRPDGGEGSSAGRGCPSGRADVRDPDRADEDTDFNDMHRLAGADAVKAAIENAAKVKQKPPRPLTRPVDRQLNTRLMRWDLILRQRSSTN